MCVVCATCLELLWAQGPGLHHIFISTQDGGLRAANHLVNRRELCVHVQHSNHSISKCVAEQRTCTSNLLPRIPLICPCQHTRNAILFPCDRSRLMETQSETHICELFPGLPSLDQAISIEEGILVVHSAQCFGSLSTIARGKHCVYAHSQINFLIVLFSCCLPFPCPSFPSFPFFFVPLLLPVPSPPSLPPHHGPLHSVFKSCCCCCLVAFFVFHDSG